MATGRREEVAVRVESGLLAGLRKIAEDDGREFGAVVEDAFRQCAKSNSRGWADDELLPQHYTQDT